MTNEIRITGHSDDLVLIEGEITRELYADYDGPTTLKITPGYKIAAEYAKGGVWRFMVLDAPENANYDLTNAEETDSYSDVLWINHPGVGYEVVDE